SAYIDSPNTPLYAFGHGLSYSDFEYSDLTVSNEKMNLSDSVILEFTLTNKGKYAGEEIVQLYIRDEVASVVRPVKELKDFTKVFLKSGERKKIRFVIDKEKLSFYNSKLEREAEPGNFEIMIGRA